MFKSKMKRLISAPNSRLALFASAVFAIIAFSAAGSAAGTHSEFNLRLVSQLPNHASGVTFHFVRPQGPNGKPKTENVGIFQLPPGTKLNLHAVPPCKLDDTTWQAEGLGACPRSFLGTGFVTLYSGLGPPVDPMGYDQHWYYAPGNLVTLYTYHGQTSPVLKVAHTQIKGATLIAPLDLPPGYPPGTKMAPGLTNLTINNYVGPHGPFVTTPPRCPKSHKWISRATLHYADGTTETVRDAMPCRAAKRHHHKKRKHKKHRRHHQRSGRPSKRED